MAKQDLRKLMNTRSPLAPREAVQPVNLYSPPVPASSPENQEGGLLASQQVSEQIQLAGEDMAGASKQVNHQTSKLIKKFASYLRPDSLKALKLIALQEDKHDYEVLQDAVDLYLKSRGA